jgi:hypothetical protein
MRNRLILARTITATLLIGLAGTAAWAQKSKAPLTAAARDLTIELRQVREGQEGSDAATAATGATYAAGAAGTASHGADFSPQQVRVRSGEKASLSLNQSQPLQWVQRIETASASLSAASASASSQSGGVTQAVTWMESGQSLSVTPHWAGGKQPAKLEIEMLAAHVDDRTGADLPATQRRHLSTTVTAPLNQWVTLATTGKAAKPGTYSSAGSSEGRTLVQIRVSAEPTAAAR